ncbi:MAG: BTAD domain-containing putative transcriptional regulator [Kineosporiaceae bacterium]
MTPRGAQATGSEPRVDVRLLGPLEVDVDGTAVELGGPRPRALLSVLALEVGAVVALDRLIDVLWDGDEPDGARNAVQVYVSRLRKALGDGGRALRAGPGGYVLALPEAAVDAVRFRRLADDGHVLLRDGHPQAAREVLGQALALWRGEALTDLGAAGEGLRAGLEAGRLAAGTALMRAGLELGHHHALVSELEDLVRRHPLDEQLVVLLMTALYRAGRQADALAAYAAAARRLDDELGIDPGTELRRLHEAVLRQEVSPPAAPAAGRAARPEPTPEPAPEPTSEPAPEPTPALPPPRPLGPPGRPLVGRAADLALVRDRLADPAARVITLLGPGGAGKTRLATEVVTQWADDALVVALAGTEDPASVVPEICRAAGAAPAWASEPALEIATRTLGGRRLLLVLDNLEQLIDRPGADEQGLADLDELIARLPELTVLCTSRSPVGLPGEYLIPIGPLPVPPATASSPEEVLDSDAVRLFRDRARAAMPEFEVTPQNAADVAAVCRMLDGLPLALELAAARVRLMPPAVLVRRESGRLGLLGGGPRSLPDRHRSIRAALDWSITLLDAAERAVFAQLSVFAGGWTLEAAEVVCASTSGSAPDPAQDLEVIDVLARLVDRSLVVADGSGRSWLLELVREYAAEMLTHLPDGAAERARAAHSAYYLELAERLGPQFRVNLDVETRTALGAETANFAVVLGRLHAEGDSERLARLVVVLLDYWYFSGALGDADRWLALAEAGDVPARTRAQLHMSAGSLAFVSGDLARAGASFDAAHARALEVGDDLLLARALMNQGLVHRYGGDHALALERFNVARALAVRAGADQFTPLIDNERGEVLAQLGRVSEGRALIERFQARARAERSIGHLATTTAQLALLAYADGDHDVAADLAGQALGAAEQTGPSPALADVLVIVGVLELVLADPARAVAILRRAARLNSQVSQPLALPDISSLLGAALVQTGEVLAGAHLLAVGRTWRQARGLAIGHPLSVEVITRAEADVAARLDPQQHQQVNRSARTIPFGSLDALEDLASPTTVDLRHEARVVPRASARAT